MARLKDRYREEVAPALKDRFEIQNPMRIPGLEKIVVNMGVGEAVANSRALDGAMEDLSRITGQKAPVRRARKSTAGFKIRDGMPVGARVTLRGERMWEFLDRLVTLALPGGRASRGVSARPSPGRRGGRGEGCRAGRGDVGVPRQARDDRASAREGLPGDEPPLLRRAGKL